MADVFSPFASRLALDWQRQCPDGRAMVMDGTLGFFDLSGYTKLTERLARSGPKGAEDIVEIADRLFQGLIEPASAFGGDVLQFSGDALLIHFGGDEHARRAVTAADAMQRFVREHGALHTDLGPVRLRMSVGIHSGPATMVLLGETQRALLAIGDHVTTTCLMEKLADSDQVLLSRDAAALVPSSWVRHGANGALLRRGRPNSPAVPATAGVVADPTWITSFTPPPLRQLLIDGIGVGDHRQVSVAFVAVRHLDALLAEVGAEALAARLNKLISLVSHLCTEAELLWAKTDALADGADLVLVGGAPTAHEDDEDRLVHVCRGLLDADFGLDLAVGANRGRNFVGVIGHPLRREYSVSGDATNLAARIMANAADGEFAVHPSVLDRCRTVVDAVDRADFEAKGKRLPVVTKRVLAVRLGGGRVVSSDLTMVGRRELVEALCVAWRASADGVGAVFDLRGPAGIGKTRLIDAAVDSIAPAAALADIDLHFATVRGPLGAAMPFVAVRSMLREMFSVGIDLSPSAAGVALTATVMLHAPAMAPWLPLIGAAIGAEVAATDASERIQADFRLDVEVTRLLDLAGELLPAGTLFVFDGLQWFDEASSTLVRALATMAAEHGWLVIGAQRDDAGAMRQLPAGAVVTLQPLSAAESERLLLAACGDVAVSDRLLTRLSVLGNGNPLFLRELVALALDGRGEFPETIERLIATRIDQLPAVARTRLRSAAVLGVSFERTTMMALLGDDVASVELAALDPFLEVEASRVRFRSEIAQRVAYAGLSHRVRASLHARVAELLVAAGEADGGRIARHWAAAARWSQSWEWARPSARLAELRGAREESFDLWDLAVRAAEHLGSAISGSDAVAAYEALAAAADRLGELPRADRALSAAQRHANDQLLVAQLQRKRGDIAEKQGRYAQSLRWYTRAEHTLGDRSHSRQSEVIATEIQLARAATLHQQDRLRDARSCAEQTLADARRIGSGELEAKALLHVATAVLLLDYGHHQDWVAQAEQKITAQHDDVSLACLHLNAGAADCEANNLTDSLRHLDQAASLFARCGDVVGEAIAINNRGDLLGSLGDFDQARACLVPVRRRCRASGYRVGELLALSGLARAAVFSGDVTAGRAQLCEALDGFSRIGHGWYAADTLVRLVECDLLDGCATEALARVDQARAAVAGLERGGQLVVWLDRLEATARRSAEPSAAWHLLAASAERATRAHLLVERATHLDTMLRWSPPDAAEAVAWRVERDQLVAVLGVVKLLTI